MSQPIQPITISIPLTNSQLTTTTTLLNQLQHNLVQQQTLLAKILSSNSDGTVLIEVAGQQLEAKTTLPLKANQFIQVQVQLQNETLQLKIVAQMTQPNNEILKQALRQTLPTQQSIKGLLHNIALLKNPPQHYVMPKIPIETQRLIKSLSANIPHYTQLKDPSNLKQALLRSGLFLENQIARSHNFSNLSEIFEQDFKAKLYKVKEQLIASQTPQKTSNTTNSNNSAVTQQTTSHATAETNTENASKAAKNQTTDTTSKNVTIESNRQVNKPTTNASTTTNTIYDKTINSTTSTTPTATTQQPATPQPTTATANQLLTNAYTAKPNFMHASQQQPIAQQASLLTLTDSEAILDELLTQINASIARLQFQQLTSIGAEQQTPLLLHSEIPVQADARLDVIDLIIKEEKSEKNAKDKIEKTWVITLQFDLPKLGTLQVQAHITEQTVSATFWSSQSNTQHFIEKQLYHLRMTLEEEGINVNNLDCLLGEMPINNSNDPLSLLDTHV